MAVFPAVYLRGNRQIRNETRELMDEATVETLKDEDIHTTGGTTPKATTRDSDGVDSTDSDGVDSTDSDGVDSTDSDGVDSTDSDSRDS